MPSKPISPYRASIILVALGLGACSDDIPDKYAAYGIPPSPDRVAKIDKITQGTGRIQYKITYEVPFDPPAYAKANSAILKDGYMEKAAGMYTGPKGSFEFTCVTATPAYCFLTIDPE
jgi:hypothetical protein